MAIYFDKQTKTFYLEGKSTTYAFFINKFGYAEHLYYGSRIGRDPLFYTRGKGGRTCAATVPGEKIDGFDEGSSYHYFPSELAFYGNGDYREPCVQVENEAGDRICELLYDSHEILPEKPAMRGMPSMRGGETLVLHLYDSVSDFGADLYYTVYPDCDVIARRVVYKNCSEKLIKLRRAYSFTMSLPTQDYDLMSLHGAWGMERRIQKTALHNGVVSIDSKRTTSSASLNPFIALCSKGATEELGEVYGVSLIYSSSYVLKAEGVNDGQTLLTGGINDFDFTWRLESGEDFETPEVAIAYSREGIGGMSREYHDAYRNYLIHPNFAKKSRPIVINSWEGTYMDFNNEKLMAIATAVKDTGIDTFVLDDGWFGARNTDEAGLGDWIVNTDKLKGGLKTIIDHVNSLGMKFGLWFEPEMVNEDSDLYRAHPEYAIHAPGRLPCYTRNQFVLDLTREDVRDYIVSSVNKVLSENKIEYVKWDYNRNVTESYSEGLPAERQAEFAHRYALGLYDIFDRIILANPDVLFEGCAGGGARFDPSQLYYFPQIWTSDDSDAEERTLIQYGTSIVYPLSSMTCHFSVVPNHQTSRITDAKTRADIAHLGTTGYELDTSVFTNEDRELTRRQIAEYKEMEPLILEGDLYRTDNPMESNFFGFTLVSKDKTRAELTCYQRMGRPNAQIKRFTPKGLAPEKNYYVPELGLIISGATLMNVGLLPVFERGDFKTVKYHFEEK